MEFERNPNNLKQALAGITLLVSGLALASCTQVERVESESGAYREIIANYPGATNTELIKPSSSNSSKYFRWETEAGQLCTSNTSTGDNLNTEPWCRLPG